MIERQNEHAMASITLRNCRIALRSCLLRRVMTSGHKSARANPSVDKSARANPSVDIE
jgi:hypothetical protein